MSIAAVVVTHNRLPLLKECLEALRKQSQPVDEIIVVDNDSSDGTSEWLSLQNDLQVLSQPNLGSAGGQYSGIKAAWQRGHEWIWCMDDDTLPAPQALEALTRCPYFGRDSTGYLASVVLWKDGSVHISNGTNPVESRHWIGRVLNEHCLGIVSASFVSVMFNRAAIERVGFPIKDYFIWSDDIEYTLRISQFFDCYAVLDSKVFHQTNENVGSAVTDNHSIKTRCYYRNAVCTQLLAPVRWSRSWPRRILRVAAFVFEELRRANSWRRRFTAFRYSMAGIPLYLKVRRTDLRR